MKSHLQVKVYSLSKEMTYIRRTEEKWKNRARYARHKQAKALKDAHGHPVTALQGAQGIVEVSADPIAYAERNFWTNRLHRVALKAEARTTHLAYGCMKGVPYSRMEAYCHGWRKGHGSTEPDWMAISDMVERFSKGEPDPQAIMQKLSEWLESAHLWFEGNPNRWLIIEQNKPAERAKWIAKRKPYVRPHVPSADAVGEV